MPPGAIQDRFKPDFIVKLEIRFPHVFTYSECESCEKAGEKKKKSFKIISPTEKKMANTDMRELTTHECVNKSLYRKTSFQFDFGVPFFSFCFRVNFIFQPDLVSLFFNTKFLWRLYSWKIQNAFRFV